MAPVQTSYSETMAAAVVGMIANSEPHVITSRIAEGSINFGVPVIQGSATKGVKAAAAGTFDASVGATVGTGNGVLTLADPKITAPVKVGVYKVVIVEPATDGGRFVVEDPDGIIVGQGAVGVAFTGPINFTLADGSTDFLAGAQIPVTVTQANDPIFRGVAVRDMIRDPANPNNFVDGDIVPVMSQGVIWVTAGVSVTPGQPAYFTTAGVWTNVSTAPNEGPVGIFESSGGNGDKVKLRLNTP